MGQTSAATFLEAERPAVVAEGARLAAALLVEVEGARLVGPEAERLMIALSVVVEGAGSLPMAARLVGEEVEARLTALQEVAVLAELGLDRGRSPLHQRIQP